MTNAFRIENAKKLATNEVFKGKEAINKFWLLFLSFHFFDLNV